MKLEKGSGKCIDEKWFCNEECIENFIRENEDLFSINDEISNKSNDEDKPDEYIDDNMLSDDEINISAYDPMQDF